MPFINIKSFIQMIHLS